MDRSIFHAHSINHQSLISTFKRNFPLKKINSTLHNLFCIKKKKKINRKSYLHRMLNAMYIDRYFLLTRYQLFFLKKNSTFHNLLKKKKN